MITLHSVYKKKAISLNVWPKLKLSPVLLRKSKNSLLRLNLVVNSRKSRRQPPKEKM